MAGGAPPCSYRFRKFALRQAQREASLPDALAGNPADLTLIAHPSLPKKPRATLTQKAARSFRRIPRWRDPSKET
jgi:hypothetical protein